MGAGVVARYEQLHTDIEDIYLCDCPDCAAFYQLSNADKSLLRRLGASISRSWNKALARIHQGGTMNPDLLAEPEVRGYIDANAQAFNSAINVGLKDAVMPDEMTKRLQEDVYVFSGFKSYHALKEASLLLRDEGGQVKPFDRFYQDVVKIGGAYNKNYLQAEYIFATQSARMAAKWAEFEADKEKYDIQYRTAGDGKVRIDHQRLDLVTLPTTDPFWEEFFPPNGWRCRCTTIQVRKGKYPTSNPTTAFAAGRDSTAGKLQIFRFNPGKQACIFPKNHPYYGRKGYGHCIIQNAAGTTSLAADMAGDEVCKVLARIQELMEKEKRSQTAAERKAYSEAMQPLLKATARVEKVIPMPDGSMKAVRIGFTKAGNKHLYSDTQRRARGVLKPEDLPGINTLLEQATPMNIDGSLYKERKDRIVRFYYFETEVRGKPLYLQVAEEAFMQDNSKETRFVRFLYAASKAAPRDKIKRSDPASG